MSFKINRRKFILGAAGIASATSFFAAEPGAESHGLEASMPESMFEIDADWQVRVKSGTIQAGNKQFRVRERQILSISQASLLHVTGERIDAMPQYDPNAAPWARGYRPEKLITFETTAADMLAPETLALRLHPTDADSLTPKRDFDFDPQWGSIGLTPQSKAIGRPVFLDYDCGWSRIDSIVIDAKNHPFLKEGKPHPATPYPPVLGPGETVLANIWIPGRLIKLTKDSIYPIVELEYPEHRHGGKPVVARLCPKSFSKLQSSAALKIIAWGDSVTAGGQASNPAHQYQNVFLDRLKAHYPNVRPELKTVAWGGRNSDSFLNEPKGAEYNFDSAVIEQKPDLVIMEFVNDSFMTPEVVQQKYSYLLKRLNDIGAEWIILTPHFVRPDWMGEHTVRIEADPRPYVAGVRSFCAANQVALADASLRWGHLVKEGIPYTTLLCNSINHPDDRGHEIFSKALIELFL